MIRIGGRHADGPVEVRQLRVSSFGFGFLDAALDFANGIEVVADLRAVRCAELVLQAGDVGTNPIEQARALLELRTAVGSAAAVAEEPLEGNTRMRFGGQRRCRRGPGEIVLVHARVAVVALTNGR